jgi:hypothetical protein
LNNSRITKFGLQIKVEALRHELFNPVLIFKQQGVDEELKVLQRDDFLLVIMTKQQLHMYEKFGGKCPLILSIILVTGILSDSMFNISDFKLSGMGKYLLCSKDKE